MNLSNTISLYDEMEKNIQQEKNIDISTVGNLSSFILAASKFIGGNRAAAKAGKSGTGLFGKEDGFMSKFGTGEGWLSKIGKGEDQFMGKFGTGEGWFSEAFGVDKSAVNTTPYTPRKTNPISFGELSDLFNINQDPFANRLDQEFEETL